jgi:adenosylhomocysteine nucleosidase
MKTDERVRNICQEMQIPNMQHGLICSGDKFISTAEEVDEIKHHFQDALAVDMESATIAQVCTLRNVPFNILRVISDTPGAEENISQYENFWTDAPKEAFMNLRQILERL